MDDLSVTDDLSAGQQKLLRSAMAQAWPAPRRTQAEIGQFSAGVTQPRSHVLARRLHVRTFPKPMAMAAGLGLALATVIWMGRGNSSKGISKAALTAKFETQRAQRAAIELPDGSSVLLGPETTLRYSMGASGHARTVTLEGQASFTVEHDPARTFSITTTRGEIRVLGTAFSVRSYANDAMAQVAVTEGRVAVRAAGDAAATRATTTATVLQPGDVVQWVPGQAIHAVQGSVGGNGFDVSFDNVPLATVVRELERRYDVIVTFADSALATRPVVLTLIDAPVSQMLELVTLAVDVRFIQSGRHVTILAN